MAWSKKEFYTIKQDGAGFKNIPENNGFLVKHNSGGSGTVTVKNDTNGNEFTVDVGQVISLNFEFQMDGAKVTVTAGSIAEVIYFK
jgi:hypothetical protein